MDENKNENKTPTYAYITLIIAFIILGVGYYLWVAYHSDETSDASSEISTTSIQTESPTVTQTQTQALTQTQQPSKNFMHTITIETNKGKIVFETYDKDAPLASKNFVDLANKAFYNGVIFHRVIKGFMIQGGDPTGTGSGGPGYSFADELDPTTESYQVGYKRGMVAMANAGPNTNGSQFFILHQDYPLPHNYTIFGRVTSGMDVLDAIANSKTGDKDKPVENITMSKVTAVQN